MGYVNQETMKITFPSDAEYFAEIRAHGSIGESEEMAVMLDKAREAGDRQSLATYAMMTRNIVRWNLTDEHDKPLPISDTTILTLRIPDFNAILSAINQRDMPPARSDEEKNSSSAASTAA